MYTRHQFLQMVAWCKNNFKKTWTQATRFLHANEENKTCEFEIVNDSHLLSYLQTNHDLSSRRKFAT